MSENKNYLYPLDDDDALSTLERGRRTVDTYRQQLAQGHGYSGLALIMLTQPGAEEGLWPYEIMCELIVSEQVWKAYCLETYQALHQNAKEGDVAAMQGLAFFYQNGYPPLDAPDYENYKVWCRKARQAGYRGQC